MPRQLLDDAYGPDGIRVTLAVEPASDRVLRVRDSVLGPGLLGPLTGWLRRRDDALVQRFLFGDRWVVAVEADSGERSRAARSTRQEAQALAEAFRAEVTARGVAALPDLR